MRAISASSSSHGVAARGASSSGSGDGGVQEQLSTFFKAPMVKNGHGPEHDFGKQQRMLFDWLGAQQ